MTFFPSKSSDLHWEMKIGIIDLFINKTKLFRYKIKIIWNSGCQKIKQRGYETGHKLILKWLTTVLKNTLHCYFIRSLGYSILSLFMSCF